jgi:hypothetical protein
MESIIVKAAADQDLYMEWSTIVEAPTFIGTYAEVLAHLEQPRNRTDGDPRIRLRRADETGTSAMHPPGALDCPVPLEGSWEDAGFIVEQRGWLPRARLPEFLSWYLRNRSKAYALLDPFDDTDA